MLLIRIPSFRKWETESRFQSLFTIVLQKKKEFGVVVSQKSRCARWSIKERKLDAIGPKVFGMSLLMRLSLRYALQSDYGDFNRVLTLFERKK